MNLTNALAYKILSAVTVAVLGLGTIFYHLVEKWTIIDSFYFCVVTLATVGYGDLVPKTQVGKLVTSLYIIIGVGIIGAFISTFVKYQGEKIRHRHEQRQSKNKL